MHKFGTTFKKIVKKKDIESLTTGETTPKSGKKTSEKTEESAKSSTTGEITKPTAPEIKKYDVPTYYIIPLKGMVGKTFVASVLEESLEDAVQREPTVVILDVDSPGGLLAKSASWVMF